jgi:hypothetical protein
MTEDIVYFTDRKVLGSHIKRMEWIKRLFKFGKPLKTQDGYVRLACVDSN